jgi:hypothetical protein
VLEGPRPPTRTVVGAGITARMASRWGLSIDHQGAFVSGYTGHIAQGGVRVKF